MTSDDREVFEAMMEIFAEIDASDEIPDDDAEEMKSPMNNIFEDEL